MSINPFDDGNGSFFFVTDEKPYSPWPAFADIPAD